MIWILLAAGCLLTFGLHLALLALMRRMSRASGAAKAPPTSDAPMSITQAAAILGVSEDADAASVKAAHHKLMQKLHPDTGGNDYLASQINQAKEVLLNQMGDKHD